MPEQRSCPRCGAPLEEDAPEGLCPRCLLEEGAVGDGSSPSDASFTPPDLRELAGHFPGLEVMELLGRGGMGAVYKARQKKLDRLVALKVLPPEVAKDPEFEERFTREARALARLSHPNIVAIHDFGEAGGFFYFVMEYTDGVSLRDVIRTETLTPAEALAIVPQICDALQYAHAQRFVHRDIKPENILLDRAGRVKMVDFGLAKIVDRGSRGFNLTGTREVVGTPHYMAPEQIERPQEVDHRADIYSLGVVFYELLTGELPLGRFALPSEKVAIDVRLDEVVLRALEKEPERRYQTAVALKSNVESVTVRPPGDAESAERVVSPGGRDGPRAPEPAPDASQETGPPQVCRFAVLGALWAPFGLVALALYSSGLPAEMPAWLRTAVTALAVVLGVPAPFGTTALGWASITRIRRAGGRLRGLPLAVGIALFYPLLAADTLLWTAFRPLADGAIPQEAAISLLVLIVVALDVYIVFAVWRVSGAALTSAGAGLRSAGFGLLVLGLCLVTATLVRMTTPPVVAMRAAEHSEWIARSLGPSAVGVPLAISGAVLLFFGRRKAAAA